MSLETELVCFTLELISLEERTLISRMRDTYTTVILIHFLECFHGALQHRHFQKSSYKLERWPSVTPLPSLMDSAPVGHFCKKTGCQCHSLLPLSNNVPTSLKYPLKTCWSFAFEKLNTCHNRASPPCCSHIFLSFQEGFQFFSYPNF